MEPHYPLLPAALLLSVLSHAQPTIPASNAPTNGDVLSYSNVEGAPLISAGANQTWVITGPATHAFDLFFVQPSSVPGYLNWPDATVAAHQGEGQYSFLKGDATGLYLIGQYDNTDGTLMDYVDTERFIAYPCTFGTTWTDGYATSPTLNGTPDFVQAPQTFVADGYGTLVGNGATFTNVLKVHNEGANDTVIGGVQYTDVTEMDLFWKPGYPMYVASVFNFSYFMDGQLQFSDTFTQMVDQLAIGMAEERSQDIGISLAPNPASDEVDMAFGCEGNATITVQDALGREVLTVQRKALTPGIHRQVLDVASLPPGTFVVRIAMADGQTGSRKLVIAR